MCCQTLSRLSCRALKAKEVSDIYIASKNLLELIQQSHCACCAEQSCAADWVSPVVAHPRHHPVCAFWKLTKKGHWIGPHCLKFSWSLVGHTECLHGRPATGWTALFYIYTGQRGSASSVAYNASNNPRPRPIGKSRRLSVHYTPLLPRRHIGRPIAIGPAILA